MGGAVPTLPAQAPCPSLSLCPQVAPQAPLSSLMTRKGAPHRVESPQSLGRLGGNRPHCASLGSGIPACKTPRDLGHLGQRHTPGSSSHRGDGGALHPPGRALTGMHGRQRATGPRSQGLFRVVWVFLYALIKSEFWAEHPYPAIPLALEPTFYPFHSRPSRVCISNLVPERPDAGAVLFYFSGDNCFTMVYWFLL